ncbi:hypothetical protein ABQD61_06925 [Enterococcus asini]
MTNKLPDRFFTTDKNISAIKQPKRTTEKIKEINEKTKKTARKK